MLAPLWAVITLRQFGARAILPGLACVVVAGATMYPMLVRVHEYRHEDNRALPTPGVLAFAESWEINDMLFMVVVENLKPKLDHGLADAPEPWFVLTPPSWRESLTFESAFNLSRMITLGVFCLIMIYLIYRWWFAEDDARASMFVRCCFLTIAWFWLLSPTQNPWYWCWALPFVPLAGNRTWYLMSAITLMYYLRFSYHGPDITDFDFVIPFFEFVPFLALLAGETWVRKASTNPSQRIADEKQA